MTKIILKIVMLFLTGFYCAASVQSAVPTMSVKEIRSGMKGVGRTVFAGTTIEEFELEVIDIMENYYPKLDIILVRLIGSQVEKTGVVSGMSGSPIYIDNKLIGALAYSIGNFSKDPIAGVMPIEYMLEIEKKEAFRNEELSALKRSDSELLSAALSQLPCDAATFFRNYMKKNALASYESTSIQPIPMSFICSGFSPELLNRVSSIFQDNGWWLVQGGTTSSSTQAVKSNTLQPGDAVSGVIISGDYSIAARGTVSYTDGNHILAFGHPFFNNGPVNMPMAATKILTTLSSLNRSFKIATAGELIGAIHQDRTPGVMGIIGESAPMIPIDVNYQSPFDSKSFHYFLAKDRSLSSIAPTYFWLTLLNVLESARFANGDYSLELEGQFILKNRPAINLKNLYSSANYSDPPGDGQDIMSAAYDIAMTYIPLLINNFEYPDIEKINLNFHAAPGKKSIALEKIWYDKTELRSGEELNLNIQLRPYQGKSKIIQQKISIPGNIAASRFVVVVGGAAFITALERNVSADKFNPRNFEDLIKLLNERKKNNQLYIQLRMLNNGAFVQGKELPGLPPTIFTILSEKKTKGSFKISNQSILKEYIVPLDYVVYGGATIQIGLIDR